MCIRLRSSFSVSVGTPASGQALVAFAQGGVRPGSQLEALLDSVEQVEQLRAFLVAEWLTDPLFELFRQSEGLRKQFSPLRREVQGADAPVTGLRSAFEECAHFELVDNRDHTAGRDVEPLGKRLLGLPFAEADGAENGELARLQFERRQHVVKAAGDRVAERGEHEPDAAEGMRRGVGLFRVARAHAYMVQL